jgi:hypothetical protein
VAGLVEHGDQGGACCEVAQRVRQQLVAQTFGQAHMKVAQQKTATTHIVLFERSFLLLDVLLRRKEQYLHIAVLKH